MQCTLAAYSTSGTAGAVGIWVARMSKYSTHMHGITICRTTKTDAWSYVESNKKETWMIESLHTQYCYDHKMYGTSSIHSCNSRSGYTNWQVSCPADTSHTMWSGWQSTSLARKSSNVLQRNQNEFVVYRNGRYVHLDVWSCCCWSVRRMISHAGANFACLPFPVKSLNSTQHICLVVMS